MTYDPNTGLEAAWLLEEKIAGADAADETGNNTLADTGTLDRVATPAPPFGTRSAQGKSGGKLSLADAALAAGFPGKSGVAIVDGALLFLVRTTASPSGSPTVVQKSNCYLLNYVPASSAMQLIFYVDAVTVKVITSANSSVPTETWTLVTINVLSGTLELWTGTTRASTTHSVSGWRTDQATEFIVANGTANWQGHICEGAAYADRGLSSDDIDYIATNGLAAWIAEGETESAPVAVLAEDVPSTVRVAGGKRVAGGARVAGGGRVAGGRLVSPVRGGRGRGR